MAHFKKIILVNISEYIFKINFYNYSVENFFFRGFLWSMVTTSDGSIFWFSLKPISKEIKTY